MSPALMGAKWRRRLEAARETSRIASNAMPWRHTDKLNQKPAMEEKPCKQAEELLKLQAKLREQEKNGSDIESESEARQDQVRKLQNAISELTGVCGS